MSKQSFPPNYLETRPSQTRLPVNGQDNKWQAKARALRIRRWRTIRHSNVKARLPKKLADSKLIASLYK